MKEIEYDDSLNPLCPHCGKNIKTYVQDPNSSSEIRDPEKRTNSEYGIQFRWKDVWHCPYCNQEFYQVCEH